MDFKALALETVLAPANAAGRLLVRKFDAEVIWTGFALSVILSVLLYAVQGYLLGAPSNAVFPSLSPAMFGVFLATLQLAYTISALIVGSWLGGQAGFLPFFGLLVWLRFVNIAVQTIAIVLVFIMPPIAIVLNLAAGVYGFYVLLHFTNVGFGLNSMAKSLGVVLLAGLGAMTAILLLMGLFVPAILETSNV
ncbi:MAG: YIP1 family protein [Alphaproteobacteria bacterium MedPE-SWcel]|nr:MAG: YIP1 family protein [Alphaproteobacteria bacterium MedPE-SWcel]